VRLSTVHCMTRPSKLRVVLAGGSLAIGAVAGSSGVVLTEMANAGASMASAPGLCINAAWLPNSPGEVALHWPTLSNSPTQTQELEVAAELGNLLSALSPAEGSGPAPLLKAFLTARTAASAELNAINLLNPNFNAPHTKVAIAGYLSTVHRQAAIGSRALSGSAMKIRKLCRKFFGTSVAQQFAIDAANYAMSLGPSKGPSRSDILAGAAHSLHAVKVLAVTPSSSTVTRVTYDVPIIYRTDVVCVAFTPLKLPSVVAC
jgi:hypothetical protein